jgi:hypothetical protein
VPVLLAAVLPAAVLPVPPPPLRFGAAFGHTRRERRQNMLHLADTHPPDVRCGPEPPAALRTTVLCPELSVLFPAPYSPTPVQLTVMRTLSAGVYAGKHVLIEAPTGTGKTMAMLITLLAMQAQHAAEWAAGGATRMAGRPWRIFFVSRTHAQLSHAQRELQSMPYETLSTTPASRDALCQLTAVPGVSRSQQCRDACRERADGTSNCSFFDRQNMMDFPHSRIAECCSGGALAATDIEDLIRKTTALGVCAFHTTRDLQVDGANVFFLTYSQALDPHIRECNGLDSLLRDSVVIFDEAHNVPGVARDAASVVEHADALEEMCDQARAMVASLEELQRRMYRPGWFAEDSRLQPEFVAGCVRTLGVLAGIVDALRTWLLTQAGTRNGWETDGNTQLKRFTGADAQALIADALWRSGAHALLGGCSAAAAAAAAPASPSAATAAAAGAAAGAAAPLPAIGSPHSRFTSAEVLAELQDRMKGVHAALMEGACACLRLAHCVVFILTLAHAMQRASGRPTAGEAARRART